ncbi:MAG: hypothetical protein ACTIBY_02925 [Staphylococcus equorum]
MNEPTEIKYSLDENEEPYFAATHIKGVAGLDFAGDEDLITIIFNLKSEIKKLNEKIEEEKKLMKILESKVEENTEKINSK